MPDELEQFWAALLSRDEAQIRQALATLTPEELQAVREHLERMTVEGGYLKAQRRAARAALAVIKRAS